MAAVAAAALARRAVARCAYGGGGERAEWGRGREAGRGRGRARGSGRGRGRGRGRGGGRDRGPPRPQRDEFGGGERGGYAGRGRQERQRPPQRGYETPRGEGAREGGQQGRGRESLGWNSGERGGGAPQRRDNDGQQEASDWWAADGAGAGAGAAMGAGGSGASTPSATPGFRAARIQPEPPRTRLYWATCMPGFERVLAQELASPYVGAHRVEAHSAGVSFRGDIAVGYAANLWCRSAVRVLERLASGFLDEALEPGDAVYAFARDAVDWNELLPDVEVTDAYGESFIGVATFSVDSRVRDCGELTSQVLASTRIKDAICDELREWGRPKPPRPEVSSDAHLPLFATFYRGEVQLYRDMSGGSLHKRGYRAGSMHRAALAETAAAGMLLHAGYFPPMMREGGAEEPLPDLVDPMCGSGAILIEAALIASDVAPGLGRNPSADAWPFLRWHDADKAAFSSVYDDACERAEVGERDLLPRASIVGNDIHPAAVHMTARDAAAARVEEALELSNEDAALLTLAPGGRKLCVTNPPWGGEGARLEGGEAGTQRSWESLAAFLRREVGGGDCYALSGDPGATRHLRMRAETKVPLVVGGVDTRLLHYKIFAPQQREGRAEEARPSADGPDSGAR